MSEAAAHLYPEDNRQTTAKAHHSLANTNGLDKQHLLLIDCLTGNTGSLAPYSRARCLFYCDRCPKYLEQHKRQKIYTTGFLLSVIADDGKTDLQVHYWVTRKAEALRIIHYLNATYQARRAYPVFTPEQAAAILDHLPQPPRNRRR